MAQFDNSYARLPQQMFTRQSPTPVKDAKLIAFNAPLAAELGLAEDAQVWGGNTVPDGADPIAQVYAGHQFGSWNPQLGDGRAVLLGEVLDSTGARFDVQLKGSGPTPYSRMGDGRAWLGPVLREYVISEAMHAMGIPTTRALAATTTGETVIREGLHPGAVVTRISDSHIRVGTFQYFASRNDMEALTALTDHVIARHYPDADGPLALLHAVITRQAELIAGWMSAGFIHGVMNTDNASIAGETIDYGPCAFMDSYDPARVFSSIDQFGRYAYQNQSGIAAWNMAQFATALIPLMPNRHQAIEDFTFAVNRLPALYDAAWREVFGVKLGISNFTEDDDVLAQDLLGLMSKDQADFTNVFANLDTARDQFRDPDAFDDWHSRWSLRRNTDPVNPQIIPRNHQVEAMITAAVGGDFAPFRSLLAAVTDPFSPLTDTTAPYAKPPTEDEYVTRTFCGT